MLLMRMEILLFTLLIHQQSFRHSWCLVATQLLSTRMYGRFCNKILIIYTVTGTYLHHCLINHAVIILVIYMLCFFFVIIKFKQMLCFFFRMFQFVTLLPVAPIGKSRACCTSCMPQEPHDVKHAYLTALMVVHLKGHTMEFL